MSDVSRKNSVIDQVKYRNRSSKQNWTYSEYRVQKHEDMNHAGVKIYFDPTQFPEFPFFVPHYKPRGVQVLRLLCLIIP